MLRRRLAAAALLTLPGVAAGAQTGDQALVRVAHFAPGLLKGDVYVVYVDGRLQLKGVPFKTVSDYLKVKPGKFKVEVREAGSGEALAKADNVKLAGGSISPLVAVGGIGEKLELLDISDAAAAVSAAGGVATGAGGTSTSTGPGTGGRRFALLLLIGGGLAATAGFVVQQRRSTR
jgi:Domain of unknown function (DUF4397)